MKKMPKTSPKSQASESNIITVSSDSNGRWYDLSEYKIKEQYPSVTTFLSKYDKGDSIIQWAADCGSYSQYLSELKKAGHRGSRVHNTIEAILKGEEWDFYMYREYWKKPDKQEDKEHSKHLTKTEFYQEWRMIEAFYNWWNDFGKPRPVHIEDVVYSTKLKTAGRIDSIWTGGVFGEGYCMVDWKTSSGIWESHKCQQCVYWLAVEETLGIKLSGASILRIGTIHKGKRNGDNLCYSPYERHTGKRYEYEPIKEEEREDQINEFRVCQERWYKDHPDVGTAQEEFINRISISTL